LAKVNHCTLCGFCRICPVVRVGGSETLSPRAKVVLQNKDKHSIEFFDCMLCHACYSACPIGVDLKLDEARKECNDKNIQTEANKKMIENVRQFGNPFGKVEKGKIPKELYCC